jgi:hypothetical protein
MPRTTVASCFVVALLAAACVPVLAIALTAKPGDTTASTRLTGVNQFSTDLDRGGDLHWASAIASRIVTRQFTPELAAGVAVRYGYESWKFGSSAAFGGSAPWGNLNAPNVAFNFSYAMTPDVQIGMVPSIGWGYESGANTGGALIYGAILSATKVYSPALVLGVGASVVRQIDETKVFPFLIVRSQIDDRWLLANPFPAGPAGGAGLELAYAIDDNRELAGGGAFRSSRFRLKDDGPTPGGIGENRFFPAFARLTRKFGSKTRLDFYAGVSAGGRLTVENAQGRQVGQDDYTTVPAIGLTLAHRY